jgi:hypothetical protein
MKKSSFIFLGLTLVLAQACSSEPKEEWISGEKNSRDTTVHGRSYRSYHGMYYPIFMNRISPNSYRGATSHEISHPGYTPVRSGGFGRTAHSHSVHS